MNIRHFFSFITVSFFIFLALASGPGSKLITDSFSTEVSVEDYKDKGSYVLKNDGTKIYASKVGIKSGLIITKSKVFADNEQFSFDEVRGFKKDNKFFINLENKYFMQRIVRGNINVYMRRTIASTYEPGAGGQMEHGQMVASYYYIQKGDNNELVRLKNFDDVRNAVKDCSLAVQLASFSNAQLRKAIRQDSYYLNHIFEVYNNNCREKKR